MSLKGDDLFSTPLDQVGIDFENEGGETYICGNPPYRGSQDQSKEQKEDLKAAFGGAIKSTKSADLVSGWFIKACNFVSYHEGQFAFVTTNSICQGRQVSLYWPAFLGDDLEINFAEPSFVWNNLASNKAAVIVSIIGVARKSNKKKRLFDKGQLKLANKIGPYLVPDHLTVVPSSRIMFSELSPMSNGSMPNDGGKLLLDSEELRELLKLEPSAAPFLKRFMGSHDSLNGETRYCFWIEKSKIKEAIKIPYIKTRVQAVKDHREKSEREETRQLAKVPFAFGERRHQDGISLLIPRHSSENRPYLPCLIVNGSTVIGDSAIALYGFKMPDLSIYLSRLHLIWVATVCGKIKNDYRYSNTLGWNTFPVPKLTQKNKDDLSRCAEDILIAREAHFPMTIADLYDPEQMPDNLSVAHDRNDETLERIYIGRRFHNDTERLEKLFELYTKITTENINKPNLLMKA